MYRGKNTKRTNNYVERSATSSHIEIFNLATEKYNLRCKHRLTIPKVQSVKHGYQTVSFRAAIIWNNLPNKYKEKKTLSSFKSAIKKWPGQNCHCRIFV